MTNKRKMKAKAIQAKTGMPYAAAINQLTKTEPKNEFSDEINALFVHHDLAKEPGLKDFGFTQGRGFDVANALPSELKEGPFGLYEKKGAITIHCDNPYDDAFNLIVSSNVGQVKVKPMTGDPIDLLGGLLRVMKQEGFSDTNLGSNVQCYTLDDVVFWAVAPIGIRVTHEDKTSWLVYLNRLRIEKTVSEEVAGPLEPNPFDEEIQSVIGTPSSEALPPITWEAPPNLFETELAVFTPVTRYRDVDTNRPGWPKDVDPNRKHAELSAPPDAVVLNLDRGAETKSKHSHNVDSALKDPENMRILLSRVKEFVRPPTEPSTRMQLYRDSQGRKRTSKIRWIPLDQLRDPEDFQYFEEDAHWMEYELDEPFDLHTYFRNKPYRFTLEKLAIWVFDRYGEFPEDSLIFMDREPIDGHVRLAWYTVKQEHKHLFEDRMLDTPEWLKAPDRIIPSKESSEPSAELKKLGEDILTQIRDAKASLRGSVQ